MLFDFILTNRVSLVYFRKQKNISQLGPTFSFVRYRLCINISVVRISARIFSSLSQRSITETIREQTDDILSTFLESVKFSQRVNCVFFLSRSCFPLGRRKRSFYTQHVCHCTSAYSRIYIHRRLSRVYASLWRKTRETPPAAATVFTHIASFSIVVVSK